MGDVNLDHLARAYRHRPASAASLARAEAAGFGLERGARVLDVGGGPGNHSAVWGGRGLRPVVLDPSRVMLAAARDRDLTGVRALAQALPFNSGCFALVWFHLSIHYGEWQQSIDEAVRVLGEDGRVEIWTLGSDHHKQSLLAQWFPSVPSIESSRFPEPDSVAAYLGDRIEVAHVSHHVEVVVRPAGEWLRAVEAGFISTLQLLPEEERADGIAAIRKAYPDPQEEISYQLRFTRIVGQ
jgi:SAM-dependent methyltransferase